MEMGVLAMAPPAGPLLPLEPMAAARKSMATTRRVRMVPRGDAGQAGAAVDVLEVDDAGVLAVVDRAGADVGDGTRGERDGLIAGDSGVGDEQFAAAVGVHVVDAEAMRGGGPEGDEILALVEGIGVLELVAGLAVAVDVDGPGLADGGDKLGARRSPDGLGPGRGVRASPSGSYGGRRRPR